MQKATEDEVDAAFAVRRNTFRDLLRGTDQLCAESVVVLHQVLERRIGPHAALVRRCVAGLLHGGVESVDRGAVGLVDYFAQRLLRLLLGIARDDETVEPERDLAAGPCWIAGSAGPCWIAGSAGPCWIAGSAGPCWIAGSAGGAGVVAHLDDLLSD